MPARTRIRDDVVAIVRPKRNRAAIYRVASCRRNGYTAEPSTENVKPVPDETLLAAGSVIV